MRASRWSCRSRPRYRRGLTPSWKQSTPPLAAAGKTSQAPIPAARDSPPRQSISGDCSRGLMPAAPEVQGLLALMLHCAARQEARRGASGEYIPLSEQDVTRWLPPLIDEAEQRLGAAAQAGHIGRFQLEAAIQSVHAQRARTGQTDWEAIALLYEGLVRLAPTTGALVGRAAAVAEARGPEAGWALLDAIPAESIKSYQPYWALAAHLLKRLQRVQEAGIAYSRAIGLCGDPAVREFLALQAR